MTEVDNNQQTDSQTPPQKPQEQESRASWLPENYNSPEEFAKSHKELQSYSSRLSQENHTLKNREAPNWSELQAKFMEGEGGLSEKDLASLSKAGYDPEFVKNSLRGHQMQFERDKADLLESVGGAEKFEQIISWGHENFNEGEKAVFDQALKGGTESSKMIVELLNLRYEKAQNTEVNTSKEPQLLKGKGLPSSEGFNSLEEYRRAVADPKYKTDPTYRKEVTAKHKAWRSQ